MKKLLCAVLAVCLLLGLCACGGAGKKAAPGSNAAKMLNGKKVIFIGCSYTYYGYVVHRGGMYQDSQNKHLTQAERTNDQAFFYQLCKANGAEVAVTDWTFGGHDLTDLFDGHCDADRGHDGYDHAAELTDRYYDYVIMQEIQLPGLVSSEQYCQNVKDIMEFFRAANPNAKFYYATHDGIYTQEYYPRFKKSLRLIEEAGVKIIDWGTLVWDVWNGTSVVADAEQIYDKNSFVVSRTMGDGYHPNPLSGYLYALMTYCAITGETAVGQPYSFCTDDELSLERYKRAYYKWDDAKTEADESATNFVEILSSAADMKGLQTLANQYLDEPIRMNRDYTVRFLNEDGSVVAEKTYQYGDVVTCKEPDKPGENAADYVFDGWDRPIVRCAGDAVYTAQYKKK